MREKYSFPKNARLAAESGVDVKTKMASLADGGTAMKLQTESLAVGYSRRVIVDDISFSVLRGEILVLIGPNGAGKSTILKTITGQLTSLRGTIYLDGSPMGTMKEAQIARRMAILMTQRPRAELMTVEDMVSTGRYPYTGRLGILTDKDKRIVDQAMEMVGLASERDRFFEEISDGQKQRALLARAIAQEPEVLILDEPTSYLDMHHKLELLSILKKLVQNKQIAVIMSLHELDLAQKCADHLLCISEGRVDRYGSPEEIFAIGSDYVQHLYHMDKGAFLPEYGSLELEAVGGEPEVFVIGGGGSGIPIYRQLQRQGIPFAAGVLQENDLEYPVAKALAMEVITEKAFEAVSDISVARAAEVMEKCKRVIVAVSYFGSMNAGNQKLVEKAASAGKIYILPK